MDKNFNQCLRMVLVHEGGFSNHPKDPGGATNRGITQRVYTAYRQREKLGNQSVKYITTEEIRTIYYRQYWVPMHCHELPSGVDWVTFDGGVNSGIVQSAKWLQRAVNDIVKKTNYPPIKVDGQIGMVTVERVHDVYDRFSDQLCIRYQERRIGMLRYLPTWATFGKGWTRRVQETQNQAIAMTEVGPIRTVQYDFPGETDDETGPKNTG